VPPPSPALQAHGTVSLLLPWRFADC
jgi:hypothetical protein